MMVPFVIAKESLKNENYESGQIQRFKINNYYQTYPTKQLAISQVETDQLEILVFKVDVDLERTQFDISIFHFLLKRKKRNKNCMWAG